VYDEVINEFFDETPHLKDNKGDVQNFLCWRGVERVKEGKLRPEKELERAKSDINCYKLKIRDTYKQIDISLEEGRLKKIYKELGIQSAFPAPQQAQSQSSRRKMKHMELEPKIRISPLECNISLPEDVPFFNYMVIEEPKYGIYFIDVFGDECFQRWSDINKVGVKTLISTL
nr:homeodomain-containing protein [Tanacetum cinerariifolium]